MGGPAIAFAFEMIVPRAVLCYMVQRGVRGRAGVIGIETRLRLFEPKSRGCGVEAAVVPHHVGFRGLQIAHASQSALIPSPARPNPRTIGVPRTGGAAPPPDGPPHAAGAAELPEICH